MALSGRQDVRPGAFETRSTGRGCGLSCRSAIRQGLNVGDFRGLFFDIPVEPCGNLLNLGG